MKDKAEITNQAVIAVIPDIMPVQTDTSLVHIPEAGDEVAERCFARARRSDQGSCCFFGNGEGNLVNDFLISIREANVSQLNPAALRLNILTTDVHRLDSQDLVDHINRQINNAQERRERANAV